MFKSSDDLTKLGLMINVTTRHGRHEKMRLQLNLTAVCVCVRVTDFHSGKFECDSFIVCVSKGRKTNKIPASALVHLAINVLIIPKEKNNIKMPNE